MANYLNEMCLQEIMVVLFNILDWIFLLMNTTTLVSRMELVINGNGWHHSLLLIPSVLDKSSTNDMQLWLFIIPPCFPG